MHVCVGGGHCDLLQLEVVCMGWVLHPLLTWGSCRRVDTATWAG